MDWNKYIESILLNGLGHFPCGSVDWNVTLNTQPSNSTVTSLAEVWIEISTHSRLLETDCVTSLAEVWIEMDSLYKSPCSRKSHFPCGSVDWNAQCDALGFFPSGSLPLRKCGLKYHYYNQLTWYFLSLPLRKCGLKYQKALLVLTLLRHFPCGSVDWNVAK